MKAKKVMSMLLVVVMICLLIFPAESALAATTKVTLYMNKKKVGVSAYAVNNVVMIPFREAFATMNCKTEWDGSGKALKAVRDKTNISLTLNSKTGRIGSKKINLKAAPKLINGKVYVPLHLVTDAFQYDTSYDAKKKRADITGKKGIGIPGGIIHSDRINPEGETWTPENGPHIIQYTFEVGGDNAPVLVIKPGTLVLFDSGAKINVGWINAGGLMVDGTADKPVYFAANTDSVQPGFYDGITFYQDAIRGKSYIRNAVIESAGSAGSSDLGAINLINHSRPTTGIELKNVLIKDSMRYGIKLDNECRLAPSSTNVSVTGTVPYGNIGGYPIYSSVLSSDSLPVGGTFKDNHINAIHIFHGAINTINQNMTWRNLGIPYWVGTSLDVGGSNDPVFTIEPGVVALFEENEMLQVGYHGSGSIVADADSDGNKIDQAALEAALTLGSQEGLNGDNQKLMKDNKAIVFGSLGKKNKKGHWYGIRLLDDSIEGNVFDGCVIAGAGSDDSGYGRRGALSAISETESFFELTNTLISGSNTCGLDLMGLIGLTEESVGNILTNNNFPIKASPFSVGFLDESTKILDNINNFIKVSNENTELDIQIIKSAIWSNLGVPYLINDPIKINGSLQEAVLTLNEGVSLVFGEGSGLEFGEFGPGSLVTLGSLANPVSFTSLLPRSGSWKGLQFLEYMGPSTKLNGIVLEYATKGITFEAVPGTDILQNSTIQFCKELGISKEFTNVIDIVIDFLSLDLGNIFKGNGQDQN